MRMKSVFSAAILIGLAASPSPQESLSDSSLKALKAATVFLKSSRGTSAGFLFRRDGRTAWVISSAHIHSVAEPITGVWNAGTPEEVSVAMKLVGSDPGAFVAVLKCELKEPPAPLPPVPVARLRESQTGFVAGFPFGSSLGSSSRAPAPTISRVTVASLIADETGALRIVQLDGELNPGQGGGPVVDGRGGLIGMAAMRVSDTKISFAVASSEITDLLEGRAFPPVLVGGSGDENAMKVRVAAGLVDPLNRIRKPVLLLVPRIKLSGPPKPGAGGAWGPISDAAVEYPLKVVDGGIDQEITVRKGESDQGQFIAQLRYTRDGATRWTTPAAAQFDFAAKPPVPNPETDRTPSPPPAAKPPELGFDVSLDETGLDADLAHESPAGAPIRQRLFTWKNRLPAAYQLASLNRKWLYAINIVNDRQGNAKQTTVRKINLETWREERSVTLGRELAQPQWGPTGLVLTGTHIRGESVAIVLDPETLQVVGHHAGFGYTLLTHPVSPFAISASGSWLTFFDLKKNAVVNRVSLQQTLERKEKPKVSPKGLLAGSFKKVEWTPDGKYLMVADAEGLHRFRVKGTDVTYEEAGMKVGGEVPFLVSPDSGTVLVLTIPTDVEKYKEKGKELERTKTFIDERWLFRIGNLGAPTARLRPFNAAHAFAFDPSGTAVFARAGNTAAFSCRRLLKIGVDGTVIAEYDNVVLPSRVEVISATRLLSWDTGLRVWDLSK
jgi:hypothetical protein